MSNDEIKHDGTDCDWCGATENLAEVECNEFHKMGQTFMLCPNCWAEYDAQ